MHKTLNHYSVMCREVLEHLALQPGDRVLDCTTGGAGHSTAMLEQIGTTGFLWGIERDPRTLERAKERLAATGFPFELVHGNFAELAELAQQHQISGLDAVLLDLGTSIFQLREAERGFSFLADGPLDMRMNPEEGVPSAADLVNTWSEAKLKDVFQTYGEERFAGRIARTLVESRRRQAFERTLQLAEAIEAAVPRRDKLHPATRVFQALRIAVNDELGALKTVLPLAAALLKPGGRLAVISFHSLEDRIVKQTLRTLSATCICPPRQPVCTCQHQPLLERPGKALQPSDLEVRENPPSRSAKLRIARRRDAF
ncbi:MAG: 16S rRNA (cytosine(1402)-N(4))-methyltransferase RsmH [Candidatus Sericytochromatia bacterium]